VSSPTYVKQLSYRPDIDGLRAFAVLAVIGYHFFPKYVRGGFVGVDIFFVISGFLIGGILHNSLSDGTFSFWEFYARRIRRIFPALILVMAAALVFGWFALLPDDYQNLGKHTLGGAGFVSNLILWRESGYFDVAMARKPLMHLWSLGIEEQFYIVLPLFLWGLSRKGMRPLTFLLLFFFVSLTANLAVYKRHPVFDFYAPLTRFWELLAGSALALMPRSPLFTRKALALDAFLGRLCFNSPPENDGRVLRDCLSFLGILILSASVLTMGVARFPGKNAVWPVLGAACVIIAGFCGTGQAGGWINRRLLAWKPLVAIGLISYPLYLWHWPLMSYAKIIYGETPHRDFRVALIFLAFVLASLTYVCLERPIRFGISARNAKTAALILVMLMSFAGGGGGGVL
jgi:peptidoglycan/LPS O-acetylase OafA/YrhL